MVCAVPEETTVAERLGSDSQTTDPFVSLRINLYRKEVLEGRETVTLHKGYVAAERAIDEAGVQVPSSEMLPTRKMFSPKVVVAISWKVTATVVPLPRAPVCMAMALRAGTVAVNVPPLTVNEKPLQVPEELAPPITSQYDPLGREVVKVVVHEESTLLIATNPRAPRPNAIC